MFPQLELALNNLLETIEKNGEFEKYVEMLADREQKERNALKRRERERKKLEKGDAFISDDESYVPSEKDDSESESSSDLDSNDSCDTSPNVSIGKGSKRGHGTSSKISDG